MSFKLSIITINYNNKSGLEKTIESVVNQTCTNFEYIVIDGKSADGSVNLIEKYLSKIDYSISEKDLGIYNAMNKGIKVANGEFVYFLNSGDVFLNNEVIETIIDKLQSSISIYYGNLYYSINGVKTLLWIPPNELTFSYFMKYSLPHPASFMKRDLFEKYFYYNETMKIVSDWEFFIYCICKENESYKHLDCIIADFDNSGISSDSANVNRIEAEKKSVYETYFPSFITDYESNKKFNHKRYYQIQAIQKQKLKWKILKGILNILLINVKVDYPQEKFYKKI